MFVMCTIISKNYVALARTLVESFTLHHPGSKAFVLLADEAEGLPGSREEPFEWVFLSEIGLPHEASLKFKYNITEFNTSVKPFFLDYLLRSKHMEKIVYFDPDILIMNRLDEVYRKLDDYSVVLTPHILSPLPDDRKRPEEIDLLKAGVYNLGFLGLARTAETHRLLQWWKERLLRYCWMEPGSGYHVDQKWMDFAPAMVDSVHVLRDPAFNAAYWNVHERKIVDQDGVFLVNGKPLVFYHFSGYVPDLSGISRHQNRFGWSETSDLLRLFRTYAEKIKANGQAEASGYRYAYDYFDNQEKIPPIIRNLYRAMGDSASRFGNPFVTSDPGSFYQWLLSPLGNDRPIPRLLYEIYQTRDDLRRLFPDPFGSSFRKLLEWAKQYAPQEYGPGPKFWETAISRMKVVSGPSSGSNRRTNRPVKQLKRGRLRSGKRWPGGSGRRRFRKPVISIRYKRRKR